MKCTQETIVELVGLDEDGEVIITYDDDIDRNELLDQDDRIVSIGWVTATVTDYEEIFGIGS